MAASNRNAAYDFSMFEPSEKVALEPSKKNNVIKIPEEDLEVNRRKHYKPTTVIASIFFSFVSLAIVATMIYSQVQLTELTAEINEKTKLLGESQSVYTQLQMKAESKLSLRAVEEYASQTLGMKKVESYQISCISLSQGDKAEINRGEAGKGILDTISDAISKLLS